MVPSCANGSAGLRAGEDFHFLGYGVTTSRLPSGSHSGDLPGPCSGKKTTPSGEGNGRKVVQRYKIPVIR